MKCWTWATWAKTQRSIGSRLRRFKFIWIVELIVVRLLRFAWSWIILPCTPTDIKGIVKKTSRVRVGIKNLRKLRTQTYISDLPDSNSGGMGQFNICPKTSRSKKIPSCPILLSISRKGRVWMTLGGFLKWGYP